MDRKRAHELQTHRLVSSDAGASAVSTNIFRAPTEPAAGTWAERTGSGPLARLRTARAAGCGGGRSAGLGESARHAECGRCRPDTVAGRRSAGGFRIYSNCLPKRGLQNTSGMDAHALAFAKKAVRCLPLPRLWRRSWVGGAGGRGASGRQDADETRTKGSGEASRVLEEEAALIRVSGRVRFGFGSGVGVGVGVV